MVTLGRRHLQVLLLLWAGTRVILLVLALNPRLYSGAILGDVLGYGAKVERMFQGEVPYRDVAIEYPPGSVPFTLVPAILVGTGRHYRLAFALTMLVVDAVGLAASMRLGRVVDAGGRLNRARPEGPAGEALGRWIPFAYVAGVFALGPLLFTRFDIVPAVCVLLAAVFAAEGRAGPAAAALGYGAAAKLFPVVLAPLLVLGLVPVLGWARALWRTVPAFLAAFALTVVPALLLSAHGLIESAVLYHVRRGVQIESLWANGIEVAHALFGLPAAELYQFGAFDLASSWSATAKALSGATTLAALGGVALLTWRRARRDGGIAPADWALVFGLGVFAFMLPTRVLSPQYLLWILPVLAGLAAVPRARAALILVVVASPLTQVIFPFRYNRLRRLEGLEIGLLTVRNLLLVAAALVIVRALWRDDATVAATGDDPPPAVAMAAPRKVVDAGG